MKDLRFRDMSSQRIVNLGAPVDAGDAARKEYVDDLLDNRFWKEPVLVATTGPGTLSSSFEQGSVIDGVTVQAGDRILVKNQATAADNGIYRVSSESPTPDRASDYAPGGASPAMVYVRAGTVNNGTTWAQSEADLSISSDPLTFTKVVGPNVWRDPVRAATTANITLATDVANGSTLDGVTLATGDRILVKDQTLSVGNGIWVVTSGMPTRASDYSTGDDPRALVFVMQGTTNGNTAWSQTSATPVIGTDGTSWPRAMERVLQYLPTTGDLVQGTGLGPTRLPIGQPGQTLRVNSAATLVEWGGGQAEGMVSALSPAAAAAETFPLRITGSANNAPLTSGRLLLTAIHLIKGTLITSITYSSHTTAMATPTNHWFALYDNSATPALLRQTTNAGTAAWAAFTMKTLSLTSTFTTTYTGLHYVGIMVQATTPPSLSGQNGPVAHIVGLTPVLQGAYNTGLTTTAPATATNFAVSTNMVWAYVS